MPSSTLKHSLSLLDDILAFLNVCPVFLTELCFQNVDEFGSPLPKTNEIKLMDFNFRKIWKIQICMPKNIANNECGDGSTFKAATFSARGTIAWWPNVEVSAGSHRSEAARASSHSTHHKTDQSIPCCWILFPVKMLTKNYVLLITDCLVTERSMDVGLRRKRDLFFLVILGRFLGHPLNGRENCLFVRPWKGISFSKYRN